MDYLNTLYSSVSETASSAVEYIGSLFVATPVDTKESKDLRFIRSTLKRWEDGELDDETAVIHVGHFANN